MYNFNKNSGTAMPSCGPASLGGTAECRARRLDQDHGPYCPAGPLAQTNYYAQSPPFARSALRDRHPSSPEELEIFLPHAPYVSARGPGVVKGADRRIFCCRALFTEQLAVPGKQGDVARKHGHQRREQYVLAAERGAKRGLLGALEEGMGRKGCWGEKWGGERGHRWRETRRGETPGVEAAQWC